MSTKDKAKGAIKEVRIRGSQLADRVRDVVEEGRARRVIVRKDDRTIVEFPLAVGVAGAAAIVRWAPMLAAIGAISALVSDISVVVEREEEIADAVVTTSDDE